jgi:hypothetical protein
MAILDLFSDRRRRERGETPDVFSYDVLPQELRVQTMLIVSDGLGHPYRASGYETPAYYLYGKIIQELVRHFGRQRLAPGEEPNEVLGNFFLQETKIESWLDAVELSLAEIQTAHQDWHYKEQASARLDAGEVIADLNNRFLQHAIGYQYASGRIIRCDSQFLHAQVVKPALDLLRDKRYRGANDEFLRAHGHYLKGEVKDCLVDCLSSLESTLKTICHKRRWTFQPKDTAKALLDISFKNGLIPAFLQSHFSSLQNTLESGVPTLRNKLGGHGQGPQVITVPEHYAAYALHLTASAIQLLVEAERTLS